MTEMKEGKLKEKERRGEYFALLYYNFLNQRGEGEECGWVHTFIRSYINNTLIIH